MSRPLVSVLSGVDGSVSDVTLPLPAVFTAPIRPDVVHYVHSCMAKNSRQAYAVSVDAGKQHSAESWGTGRAVSRIPRVSGGGTHAAGAGAFGNMCRGGRMFSPNKVRACLNASHAFSAEGGWLSDLWSVFFLLAHLGARLCRSAATRTHKRT